MRYFLFFMVIAVLFSCNKPKHTFDNAKLEQLADRTCRAIGIREQRFTLANKIRFTQDSLRTAKGNDTLRFHNNLKLYLSQKAVLLKQSLSLADTIRTQLDSLEPYTDKEARKKFNLTLDSLLAKKGCGNK